MKDNSPCPVTHRNLPWMAGLFAFLWVLLRSGLNPKRLSYPCQQAAIPVALGWLVSIAVFLTGSVLFRRYAKVSGATILVAGAVWFSTTFFDFSQARTSEVPPPPSWEVPNPLSKVFLLDTLPPTNGTLAAGDSTVPNAYLSDPAIDALVMHMQSQGISLYKSDLRPNGIVGANDIVLIKPNFYFEGRNTTNTDRMKGIIWAILNHPSGFTGEIIVFENTQGGPIDDNDNNSDDPNQSIIDVINTFRAKHYPVYLKNCTLFRTVDGSEYSDGDYSDCFVYDPEKMYTWPKFKSPSERHYISLRYGIWDSTSATYDTTRKCILDMPVLKSHNWAGATIVIKSYVGFGTTAYDERWGGFTAMHETYFFGPHALLARAMSTSFPRLSIVDAKWTNTDGPGGSSWVYTNMLVASTDPLAADWYAAKYILTPLMVYPHWTNPDYAGGTYSTTMGNWARYFHDSTNHVTTKDSAEISVYRWTWDPVPIQLSRFSGTLVNNAEVRLEWETTSEINNYGFYVERRTGNSVPWAEVPNSFVAGHGTTTEPQSYEFIDRTPPRGTVHYRLRQVDLNGTVHYTEPITVQTLTAVDEESPFEFALEGNYPNPFNPTTEIRYQISEVSHVTLRVFDLLGREVATVVNEELEPGAYEARFDARNLATGIYIYALHAGSFFETKKMIFTK